jgi:hypothetical protein
MAEDQGVKASIDGNELVLRLPLKQPYQPSSSGKTMVVATSHGPVPTNLQVETESGPKTIVAVISAYFNPRK